MWHTISEDKEKIEKGIDNIRQIWYHTNTFSIWKAN